MLRSTGMREGYQSVTLATRGGPVACRYYRSDGARAGTVCVGGVGGEWDTPARDLYPRLARGLLDDGIASLRIRYRNPTDLEQSIDDVLAGLAFLAGEDVNRFALVGHSFGGAVVITAASRVPGARTVVALAPQSHGAEAIASLAPGCSVLLVHGTRDTVLPAACSQSLYAVAGEPKRLVLYRGAGHVLDEVAAHVHDLVAAWLRDALAR